MLKERIFELSKEVFGFDFPKYLEVTNKSLFAVKINRKAKCYEELFGETPASILNVINRSFFEAQAGYSYDLHNALPGVDIPSDLFLLCDERLDDKTHKIDALIIHELCHLIIDSNNVQNTTLEIDDSANYLGKKMWDNTDIENEAISRHTIEFCTVLAAASLNAMKYLSTFDSKLKVINQAMRFDMKGRLRI